MDANCAGMLVFLLECGADPQVKDRFGRTPRDYAKDIACTKPLDDWLLAKWDKSLELTLVDDDDVPQKVPTQIVSPVKALASPRQSEATALLSALTQIKPAPTPIKSPRPQDPQLFVSPIQQLPRQIASPVAPGGHILSCCQLVCDVDPRFFSSNDVF
jgi:hypothetical protein